MTKVAAITLLFLGLAVIAVGKPRDKATCKAFFLIVEQDAITVKLSMVGLNKRQSDWYEKNGNQKEYAGVCLVNANASGGQVALEPGMEASAEQYVKGIIGDSPVYLIDWEEHAVFVP